MNNKLSLSTFREFLTGSSILISILILVCNALLLNQIIITPDGSDYIKIAQEIAKGDYWGKQSLTDNFNNPSSIRTPLYPFLIYLASIFGDLPGAILVLHWILAAFTIILCCYFLKSKVSPEITLIGITLGVLINSYLAVTALTEWCGFLGMLVIYAMLFLIFERGSILAHYFIGLISALLILLKPVFLLPSLLIIFFLQVRSNSWGNRLILSLTFLIPLIAWMSFNFYRQDSFSISPYGKFSLFGVAALVGNVTIEQSDSAITKEFIEFANNNKFPPMHQESEWMDNILSNYRLEKYDHNLWLVADKFRRLKNLSRQEINTLCGIYSWRSISSNLTNYFKYILAGIYHGWLGYLISLTTVVICLQTYRKYPDLKSLASATSAIALLHILTITIAIMNITWLPRYEWMTGTPVTVTLFILVLSILESKFQGTR